MCNETHPLIKIYTADTLTGFTHNVMWCPECGCVVVDLEVDGRVAPGAVMRMKSPRSHRC